MKATWLELTKHCVDRINTTTFCLDDFDCFFDELKKHHPGNNHIRAKIRQQLQILRDQGYVKFVDDNGTYEKLVK